jgi:ATP-dependent helicase/nuclease subunit B
LLPTGAIHVVPTRRLAHFLRARHDAASQQAGLTVWRTPEVVTWPELLRRQFEVDRVAGRTTARWLPASHGRLAWERIVRGDDRVLPVLSPGGLGHMAYRSWGLLHQYRIPYAALATAEGPEVAAFAGWVETYRRWLRQGDWLDPAVATSVVGSFATDVPLAFHGFDRWTPEQSDFVEALQAAGVPVSRPQAAAPRDSMTSASVVECNDLDAELEAAARWAAARLQATPLARLAVVIPGLADQRARVRRMLDRVLAPASALTGGPAPEASAYELAAARPLVERPLVAAALAWLEACAYPPDLAATSSLLLGPYDGAAALDAHARAELDVSLRRLGLQQPGLDRVLREARRSGCDATADLIEASLLRSRTWSVPRLPSEWAPEFAGLLRDLGWPGAEPTSAEHQAAQRWQALLGEFGASDDVTGPLRLGAALSELRALALDTAFEPQEIAAPLLVIDPDTATGMHFDALWVCGLDAARWPAPANPDPFLPRDWQVRQGVPGATAELSEQVSRRTLQRLSQSAPVVVFSVPRYEDEAPLLPSTLIADLPRLVTPDCWGGADATHASFESRPSLVTVVDGQLPAFANHEVVKGGTRLLELQSACPFRAAVELRLGARELEDPAAGIAPTERGTLAHDMLEAFWNDVHDQATLAAMPVAERATRVRSLAERVLEPLRAVADDVRQRLLDLEQRWLEARVLDFIALDLAREPFSVVQTETERCVEVGGVQVRVKLDRVDRLADGSLAVIDYKTGSNARPASWMGERPESPQLPLYVRVVGEDDVSAVAFGVVRKGATGYIGIARDAGTFSQLKPFDATRAPFKEYADWQALMREWQRRLDAIAREHAAGDARLAPNPTRACVYCHLPALCRSGQAFLEAGEADDASG